MSTLSNSTEQTQKSSSSSFWGYVDKLAPGKSPEDLLNPPPPCFQRQPPHGSSRSAFESMAVVAVGDQLDTGFPPAVPPSSEFPHPFVSHDVGEEDWAKFVDDMKRASSLSLREKVRATALPATFGMLPGACYVARVASCEVTEQRAAAVQEDLSPKVSRSASRARRTNPSQRSSGTGITYGRLLLRLLDPMRLTRASH